jgi:hypothetical protein
MRMTKEFTFIRAIFVSYAADERGFLIRVHLRSSAAKKQDL